MAQTKPNFLHLLIFCIVIICISRSIHAQVTEENLPYLCIRLNAYEGKINLFDTRNEEDVLQQSQKFMGILDIKNLSNAKYSRNTERVAFLYGNYSLIVKKYSGETIASFKLLSNEKLGPDWKRKLFIKDYDLWIADLNWESGQLENERRLTELGIFKSMNLTVYNWYKNKVLLRVSAGNDYQLAMLYTDTGELKPFDLDWPNFNKPSLSPNHRYMLFYPNTTGNYGALSSYDFEKEAATDITQDLGDKYPQWINDHELFILKNKNHDADKDNQSLIVYDFTTNEQTIKVLDDVDYRLYNYFKNPYNESKKTLYELTCYKARVSQDSNYLIMNRLAEIDVNQPRRQIIYFLKVSDLSFYESDISFAQGQGYRFPLEWVDDKNLICTDKSDVFKQGTFIYDVESREKTKVSNLIAEKIVTTREGGHFLFEVNGKIYASNLNSNEAEMISEPNPGEKIQYLIQKFNYSIVD